MITLDLLNSKELQLAYVNGFLRLGIGKQLMAAPLTKGEIEALADGLMRDIDYWSNGVTTCVYESGSVGAPSVVTISTPNDNITFTLRQGHYALGEALKGLL
jgi:hypothetical protein